MSGATARGPTPGRALAVVVVALVAAAAALWGSSRLTWVAQVVESAVPAAVPRTITADGARAEAILVPWALLCLAAIGGLVATSGWGRRVIGMVVLGGGVWTASRAAVGWAAPDAAALPDGARPGDRPLPVEAAASGPLVALLAGVIMIVAGVLIAQWADVLPRMGARYDAPGAPGDARADPARARPTDPDRALWEALDEGRDPTRESVHRGDDGPGPERTGSGERE